MKSSKIEQTLVIIKPDAVTARLTPDITQVYIDNGLEVIKRSDRTISLEHAKALYKEHEGKPFYDELIQFTTSKPCVILIIQGENAVGVVRKLNGPSAPKTPEKGTIRGDFKSLGGVKNLVHGSDSVPSAKREIAIFFGDKK